MQKISADFKEARLLVADDFPINVELISEMLEMMNCKVDTVENGEEAYEKHMENDYDLILMDIQMPVLDGYQATKKIKESEKKNPIIVAITANALSGDKDKCLAAGMDDYISKPIKGVALEEILSKYL